MPWWKTLNNCGAGGAGGGCNLYGLVVLTTTSCLLQQSESFLLPPPAIPPTRISRVTTTWHVVSVIPHHNYHEHFFDVLSTNHYSVGGGGCSVGGITTLFSSHQSQNTFEEKEKSTTKTKRRTWEETFQLLVSYKEKHGNCNVPQIYREDRRLGLWVKTQRRTKDRLSDERIEKLNDLGFLWSNILFEEQWDEMFEKLIEYSKENNGDCNLPKNYDNNYVYKELYRWVEVQRKRKSLLSEERRTRLDNLGLIWEDANKVKADQKWNSMFDFLQEYKQKYGHCRVPQKWEENLVLGLWVSKQRKLYRKGQLREDRQIKLDRIDFTWKVRDGNQPNYVELDLKWFVKFTTLLNFFEEYGHCNVPYYYKKYKSLGHWVSRQRKNQKKGTLHDYRKGRLDDIGFMWSFDDQRDEQWRKKYEELKRFKEINGHLRLPPGSIKTWRDVQRIQFAAGKVSPERKALLDEIDFRWDIVK